MSKAQFLQELTAGLQQLPPEEVARQRDYYDELLSDMVEDGMSEEEAVAKLGSVQEIIQNILQDTPLPTLVRTRLRPKNGWTAAAVVVTILGAPLWVPLLLAFVLTGGCVALAIWAVIAAFFLIVFALGIAGIIVFFKGFTLFSFSAAYVPLSLGSGLLLLGLALLIFLGAEQASVALFRGGRWIYRSVKGLFIQKEAR